MRNNPVSFPGFIIAVYFVSVKPGGQRGIVAAGDAPAIHLKEGFNGRRNGPLCVYQTFIFHCPPSFTRFSFTFMETGLALPGCFAEAKVKSTFASAVSSVCRSERI